MSKRRVVYIAHPLSAPTREGIEQNRRNATAWAVWAVEQGVSPSCTWIVLTGALEETAENRAIGLDCDVALAIRSDEVWLVGGRVTAGMRIEANAAKDCGVPIVDLTHLGALPPGYVERDPFDPDKILSVVEEFQRRAPDAFADLDAALAGGTVSGPEHEAPDAPEAA